jgi:hypothetical protein
MPVPPETKIERRRANLEKYIREQNHVWLELVTGDLPYMGGSHDLAERNIKGQP